MPAPKFEFSSYTKYMKFFGYCCMFLIISLLFLGKNWKIIDQNLQKNLLYWLETVTAFYITSFGRLNAANTNFSVFSLESPFYFLSHLLVVNSRNMGLVQLVRKFKVVSESHIVFKNLCIFCGVICNNLHVKAIFPIFYWSTCFIFYFISKILTVERWDLYS